MLNAGVVSVPQQNSDKQSVSNGPSDSQWIEIAREAAKDKVHLQMLAPPVVEHGAKEVIVTFPVPYQPGYRGRSYDAKVTIDSATRKVTQILGGD